MRLTKIFLLVLAMVLISARSFAAAPEITADEKYFNIMKGHYVLRGNVDVKLNNRGMTAEVSADEARVNLLGQKCWATGNVKFLHDEVIFSCEKAYLQWSTKTADVAGKVSFVNKDVISITADSATFNWSEKIADFYGAVQVTPEKNFALDENLTPEKITYAHVQFNVRENKILALDKTSETAGVEIPESDVETN